MGVNHLTRSTQNNPPAELLPRTQTEASKFVTTRIKRHFAKI